MRFCTAGWYRLLSLYERLCCFYAIGAPMGYCCCCFLHINRSGLIPPVPRTCSAVWVPVGTYVLLQRLPPKVKPFLYLPRETALASCFTLAFLSTGWMNFTMQPKASIIQVYITICTQQLQYIKMIDAGYSREGSDSRW